MKNQRKILRNVQVIPIHPVFMTTEHSTRYTEFCFSYDAIKYMSGSSNIFFFSEKLKCIFCFKTACFIQQAINFLKSCFKNVTLIYWCRLLQFSEFSFVVGIFKSRIYTLINFGDGTSTFLLIIFLSRKSMKFIIKELMLH